MGQKVNPIGLRISENVKPGFDAEQRWKSNWFTSDYSKWYYEDTYIREYVKYVVQAGTQAGGKQIEYINNINIIRSKDTVKVVISLYVWDEGMAWSSLDAGNRKELPNMSKASDVSGQESKKAEELISTQTVQMDKIETLKTAITRICNPTNTAGGVNDSQRRTGKSDSTKVMVEIGYIGETVVKSAYLVSQILANQLERRIPLARVKAEAFKLVKNAPVKGIKAQFSGRFNGVSMAQTHSIVKGQVPLHSFRAKIDYSCATAYTTYGTFGVKVWITA